MKLNLPLVQIVLQVVMVVVLLRAKKRKAALPEPARGDQTYGVNAMLIGSGIIIAMSLVSLVLTSVDT